MKRTHHMVWSIDGLLRLSDRKLAGLTGENGKKARAYFMLLKNKGDLYFPCGKACDKFDPKLGCTGHEEEE
jgi:hypothetical protein